MLVWINYKSAYRRERRLLIDQHHLHLFTYILNHINQINNISSQRSTLQYNTNNTMIKQSHNTNIRC